MAKRSRREKKDVRKVDTSILNEGPEVVGKMSAIIGNNGSMDSAIREIASNGPHYSSAMFKEIVDDADTRVNTDMVGALSERISNLPESCNSYTMALRMIISASKTKDDGERSRILKDSSEIALDGLRDAGKTFSSSLNTPCMAIFGVGIMIPMILMSIMPMIGMSGLFGPSALDDRLITVVTLVLIPCLVLAVIAGISRKNPLRRNAVGDSFVYVLPLLSCIPIFLATGFVMGDIVLRICVSAILTGAVSTLVSCGTGSLETRNLKTLSALEKSIFEIGNRLLSGYAFENAVGDTLLSRKVTRQIGEEFVKETELCRGNIKEAVSIVFSKVSTDIADVFTDIYNASLKNPYDAGRLALSLGRQMNDRESLRRTIRNDLKSMTDTMFGTASIFAPLVLGLSVKMLEPMKNLVDSVDTGNTSAILSIYLCELCAVISILLSFIDGKCSVKEVVRKFSKMVPLSLGVFLVAMNVGF